MIHVVIISPVFAVDDADTVTLPFLQVFCKGLTEKIRVTIVAEKYPLRSNYNWNGVNVYTLKKKTPRIFYKFLRARRFNKALSEIHKENPIDVIHNMWFNVLGQISFDFSKRNGIKHIITLAGQDILKTNNYRSKLPSYNGVLVSPSEFHKQKLLEDFTLKVKVISWGIEPIAPQNYERTIDLIQCGWINPVKNNNMFLDILKALGQKNINIKAVICGGGPGFEQLKLDVKQMNLNKVVELKDHIPRQEVIELMQRSKILVHTSNFESFGLVLAEALACGNKVLSTPVGLAYDNPHVLRCNSVNEFVDKIETLLSQKEKLSPSAVTNYPISRTVEEYLKIYERTGL